MKFLILGSSGRRPILFSKSDVETDSIEDQKSAKPV